MAKKKSTKSLPQAAWDYRARWFPGISSQGHYVSASELEQAFMAGARWAKRQAKAKR